MKRIPTTEPPATVQEATTVTPNEPPTLAELWKRLVDANRALDDAIRARDLVYRAVRDASDRAWKDVLQPPDDAERPVREREQRKEPRQ